MSNNDHSHDPSDPAIRVEALEALLVEKGLIDSATVDDVIRLYEENVGPMNGARLVARAWTDPDFKARLLENADDELADFDFSGMPPQHLVVVENTGDVHNVVVCTLCSCYPWGILGLPPEWYKAPAYRSRVVREPRVVLAEMGLELEDTTEVRVWDSSSEVRYMVLPERPSGTEELTEEQLAELVTRNSMIGVAKVTVDG